MTATRHLVAVWDPSRGDDAMQAHIQLLLDARRRERDGQVDDEEVFVWWGKIRSPNRQQAMPHLPDILALDALLGDDAGPDAEIRDAIVGVACVGTLVELGRERSLR